MWEGARFVEKELPNVRMAEALRVRTSQVCRQLVSTRYDIVTELADFYEPVKGKTRTQVMRMRVERIDRWLFEYLPEMNEIVQALATAAQGGHDDGGAYILVAETAAGILGAYGDVRAGAERILGTPAPAGPSP